MGAADKPPLTRKGAFHTPFLNKSEIMFKKGVNI